MNSTGIFCEHCNSPIRPGNSFCETCGKPAEKQPSGTTEKQPCPKCHSTDKSYSVEEYLGIKFTDEDIKKADEADKTDPEGVQLFYLVKPERPKPDKLLGWLVLPWIPVLNFLLMWLAPMHRRYKMFMAGIFIVFIVSAVTPQLREKAIYAFVGCFMILFYYAALLIDRKRIRTEYLTRELPEYERAIERWPHLRYCQNCEICWLDNAPGRTSPVEETEKFLSRPD